MIDFKRFALCGLLLLAGCQELTVENENQLPGERIALTFDDIETLGASLFATNWERQGCGEAMMLQTMADANSSSWSNWGMRDMSSEPRVAWDNDPAYNWRTSIERPWFGSYAVIANANDVLRQLAVLETAGEVTANQNAHRLRAFAQFNRAWAHAYLALIFDQAFVVDETIDLEAVARGDIDLPLLPYTEVMTAAIAQMEEALLTANDGAFVISATDDWVFGLDMDNNDLAALGHSFIAQWMAQVARTPAERAAANWPAIMSHISEGITDTFAPVSDGETEEWDCVKWFFSNGTTWSRIDYKMLGPADESGGFEAWENTPLQERLVFEVLTSDRRIVGGDGRDPFVNGTYTQFQGTNGPFPAIHGTYHYSSHNHRRWLDYVNANATGPMVYMLPAEMDLLMAEGLLHTSGDLQQAVDLINNTRVVNGELPPAQASETVGSPEDAQSHLETASLWAKLKHEKRWETLSTSSGLEYFDDRGWGDLTSGTPVHFPVPGSELVKLALQNYTFGGDAGSSAGRIRQQNIQPIR
ncbi:MAG: RagB/SusD family nutrient uptake outer membrane protein [Bacteroidota bacterium]